MNNPNEKIGLGTALRNLLELLDGDVQKLYSGGGVDSKPKFFPIYQALIKQDAVTIKQIAEQARISHSAVSQTITEMTKRGLVASRPGQDGRERLISITQKGKKLVSKLQDQWLAINKAAQTLDAELDYPLSQLITEATVKLQETPFQERILRESKKLSKKGDV